MPGKVKNKNLVLDGFHFLDFRSFLQEQSSQGAQIVQQKAAGFHVLFEFPQLKQNEM